MCQIVYSFLNVTSHPPVFTTVQTVRVELNLPCSRQYVELTNDNESADRRVGPAGGFNREGADAVGRVGLAPSFQWTHG